MVKWLKSNANLTGAVIATRNVEQFRENVGRGRRPGHGSARPCGADLLSGYNKGLTCLLCAQWISIVPNTSPSRTFSGTSGTPGIISTSTGRRRNTPP